LFSLWNNYHEEYEKVYPEKYENEYGFFRTIVKEIIQKYLNCGILEHARDRRRTYATAILKEILASLVRSTLTSPNHYASYVMQKNDITKNPFLRIIESYFK